MYYQSVLLYYALTLLLYIDKDELTGFPYGILVMMINMQVKNFILLGDIHKSIYFLSWKEQMSQLNLLAKDFGSLDCLATEFLIDGSTLSLIVSDDQKNVQVSCLFVCGTFEEIIYRLTSV